VALALGMVLAGAPGPAMADQTQDFYNACMKASHEAALCRCKAEAAPKIIDSRMEGFVIAAMKGSRDIPADVLAKWATYQSKSDAMCKGAH
jgi:hypothetical protein